MSLLPSSLRMAVRWTLAALALIVLAAARHAAHAPARATASAHPVASRSPGAPAPPATSASGVKPPSYAPGQAGMVVGVDPETGRLGPPTPEQRAKLGAAEQNALSRSSEGLVEEHHPDGSVSIDLQGRFQEFAVVHMDPAGRPVVECLDDPAAIERALKQAPLAPAQPALRTARRTHTGRPAIEDR